MTSPISIDAALAMTESERADAIFLAERQKNDLAISLSRLTRAARLTQLRKEGALLIQDEFNYHAFIMDSSLGIPALCYMTYNPLKLGSAWVILGFSNAKISDRLKAMRNHSDWPITISDATIDAAIAHFTVNLAATQAEALVAPRTAILTRSNPSAKPHAIEEFTISGDINHQHHHFASHKSGQLVLMSCHDGKDLGETAIEIADEFLYLLDHGYAITAAAIATAITHHSQVLVEYRDKVAYAD